METRDPGRSPVSGLAFDAGDALRVEHRDTGGFIGAQLASGGEGIAGVDGLAEADVGPAIGQPAFAEDFEDNGGEPAIDGDAADEGGAEAVLRGNGGGVDGVEDAGAVLAVEEGGEGAFGERERHGASLHAISKWVSVSPVSWKPRRS